MIPSLVDAVALVLVLLGAASVALVLIGWLARSGRIEGLLDQVFDEITSQL